MASMFEQSGSGTLFLGGQKISGADIRDQNGMSISHSPHRPNHNEASSC